MATWDELRAAWAPPGTRLRAVGGPPLRDDRGMRSMPSVQPVLGLAWSADGRRVAAASGGRIAGADGLVRVAEPATGRTTMLHGHAGGVHAVAFDPRTGWLASAGHDGVVGLWDLERGEGFPIPGRCPRSRVAFAGDSLLAGDELPERGESSAFTMYDLAGARVREEALPADYLVHAFAVDAGRIALFLFHVDGARHLECRAFPTWERRWSFDTDASVQGLGWADGALLMSSTDARRVRSLLRLDPDSGEVLQTRIVGETFLGGLHVGVGRVATIGADEVLGLWRTSDLEPIAAIPVEGFKGSSVALSPDGAWAAIGSATGDGVRILSLR